jgi:integrase
LGGVGREPDGTVVAVGHRGNHPAIRTMFNDAMRDRLVVENPFGNLRVPQSRGRKGIMVLTEAELAELIGFAHRVHGPYGPMFGAMISVAAWTGVRPGELFAIRWRDVDMDAGELRIREQFNTRTGTYGPTKNSFPRTVVLPPAAAEALKGIPRHLADDIVFRTVRGLPYTGRTHHHTWNPVRKAFVASLPEHHHLRVRLARDPGNDFDFYELRHFCATHLLELGLAPADVALQLGHRDGGALVMSTYGHPSEDAARDRIRQAFAKAS